MATAYDQATSDLNALDAQIATADASVTSIGQQIFGQASVTGSAYAVPIGQYQTAGAGAVQKIGPEIQAVTAGAATTLPYTVQAQALNATLAGIPTSGRSNVQGQQDAANAAGLARQISSCYRNAIFAGIAATTSPAPPTLPEPPAPPTTPPVGTTTTTPTATTTPATPAPSSSTTAAPSTVQVATAALGWKALLVAYGVMHPAATAPSALAFALAQAMGEGSFTGYFRGTNNFGAMHATAGFASKHANDPGYGMVAFLDHAPAAYISRMAVYPTLALGAQAYLTLLEADLGSDWSALTTPQAWAQGLYLKGYYGGWNTPRTPLSQRAAAAAAGTLNTADQANIAAYAAMIQARMPAAQAAIASGSTGDPTAATSGTFAPLEDRLTPAPTYAPHTMAHALELLGAAATSPPPGAVSIADCQAAGGQGVWMFASGATVLPVPGAGAPSTVPAPGSQPVAAASSGTSSPLVAGVIASALLTVGGLAIAKGIL